MRAWDALRTLPVVMFVAACTSPVSAWEGGRPISISPLRSSVAVGDTVRFRVTYDGRPCDCRWVSSDTTKATVDATGLVRGIGPGLSTVIATSRRDQNAKTSAIVDVVARDER